MGFSGLFVVFWGPTPPHPEVLNERYGSLMILWGEGGEVKLWAKNPKILSVTELIGKKKVFFFRCRYDRVVTFLVGTQKLFFFWGGGRG